MHEEPCQRADRRPGSALCRRRCGWLPRGVTLAALALALAPPAAAGVASRATGAAAAPAQAAGGLRHAAAEIWTRVDLSFEAAAEPRSPLHDLEIVADFTSPSGRTIPTAGFWDGFRAYRVRFLPDELGEWTWTLRLTRGADDRLAGQRGRLTVTPYRGDNPLYRHGLLRVSDEGRSFVHADGTPFFWLADTAWNGALKAGVRDWRTYLEDRRAKGFNVIQFVTTQWRAASGNADGRPAYYGLERITIDPIFFRWLDRRVDAINEAGLVAAPVLIWAIGGSTARLNPGATLPDDQLILLARYLVARYGAHHVAWMLAGDADYRGALAERWRTIGRAVFGDAPRHLATMHPGGRMWVADEFRGEAWFAFNGYQSSHGAGEDSWRWQTEGPPAREWAKSPALPSVNLEPNYEAHVAGSTGRPFDAHAVRRAAYWSLLVAPPAGVSYGAHGIWSWETEASPPMTHAYTGVAAPWHEAMALPGSTSMQHLGALFRSVRWWTLRPAQELVARQPGATPGQADRFIAAARSEADGLAVVYIPAGGAVTIDMANLGGSAEAAWFDPASGERTPAGQVTASGAWPLRAPRADQDWVLLLSTPAPRVPSAARAARPNIVFILADDLGINDLASYGRRDHRTPRLDQLAREGTRFTSAYVAQPICSPSRAAIMTGKAPARLHLTTYLPGRSDAPSQRLLHPLIAPRLQLPERTLGEHFRDAGYATGYVGKWHLGGQGFLPTDQGFDSYDVGRANTAPSDIEGGKGEYDLTSKAIAFIEANRNRPFLLYLAHNSPHIPYAARPSLIAKHEGAFEPAYAALIETLDDTVGRLLDRLDSLGLAANTIVVFTSDNGGLHVPEGSHARITHNTPFRAGKGFLYEGGLRVPLIVRWPDGVPGGRTIRTPVVNTGWLPTLLELAGQPVPAGLDGGSFARVLGGGEAQQTGRFFWHFPHYTNQGSRPAGAVRDGPWKLVEHYEDGRAELFDLDADPAETRDLSAQQPERVVQMRQALADWRKAVGAQANSPNPGFQAELHRSLYLDMDVSMFDPPRATAGEWERMQAWRRAMDAAIR